MYYINVDFKMMDNSVCVCVWHYTITNPFYNNFNCDSKYYTHTTIHNMNHEKEEYFVVVFSLGVLSLAASSAFILEFLPVSSFIIMQ